MVTSSHEIEFTVRNLCSFEIIRPPTIAVTGTNTVPGRMATPAPRSEWRWVTRNYTIPCQRSEDVNWEMRTHVEDEIILHCPQHESQNE